MAKANRALAPLALIHLTYVTEKGQTPHPARAAADPRGCWTLEEQNRPFS